MRAALAFSPPPILTRVEADVRALRGDGKGVPEQKVWRIRTPSMPAVSVGLSLAIAASAIAWGAAQRQTGALDGMCIALDMAMAHGALDDATRALVTETIASPANPYFDRIAIQSGKLTHRCREIAAARFDW